MRPALEAEAGGRCTNRWLRRTSDATDRSGAQRRFCSECRPASAIVLVGPVRQWRAGQPRGCVAGTWVLARAPLNPRHPSQRDLSLGSGLA